MKITKLKPGESGFDNSIPKSLRDKLDREPHDKEVNFVRDKFVEVCNCQTGGNKCHNTIEKDGVCQLCGYFTFRYNLTGREDKTYIEMTERELGCVNI